jgi:hypothetical protein
VLSDFQEARDITLAARMPGSLGSEGDSRQKSPIETEGDTRTLNAYFTVAEGSRKRQSSSLNWNPATIDLLQISGLRRPSRTWSCAKSTAKFSWVFECF